MGRTSDANERLMDAAISLMWEQSYGTITIDAICQAAGVKKGSFYYFFASKGDLAVAALERNWLELKPIYDNAFAAEYSPLQRIRNICNAFYQEQVALQAKTGRVLGCPFCAIGSEICQQEAVICTKICEVWERKLMYWHAAITEAQQAGEIGSGDVMIKARCAMAYFDGMAAQARLLNNLEMLESLGDRVCEHIFAQTKPVEQVDFPTRLRQPKIVEVDATQNFDPTKY